MKRNVNWSKSVVSSAVIALVAIVSLLFANGVSYAQFENRLPPQIEDRWGIPTEQSEVVEEVEEIESAEPVPLEESIEDTPAAEWQELVESRAQMPEAFMKRLDRTWFIPDDRAGGDDFTPRVINGQDADPNEYPFVARLVFPSIDGIWCGATILNDQWLMTAAHCVDGIIFGYPVPNVAVLGDHNLAEPDGTELEVNIEGVAIHPAYDYFTLNNDIALLLLEEPIQFNEYIQPLTPGLLPAAGADIETIGWGVNDINTGESPDILQEITLQLVDQQACKDQMDIFNTVTDQMFCLADDSDPDASSCYGDSGTAAFGVDADGNVSQLGIVSWGIGCGGGFPGVYTRIDQFLGWVDETLLDPSAVLPIPEPSVLSATFNLDPGMMINEGETLRLFGTMTETNSLFPPTAGVFWGDGVIDFTDFTGTTTVISEPPLSVVEYELTHTYTDDGDYTENPNFDPYPSEACAFSNTDFFSFPICQFLNVVVNNVAPTTEILISGNAPLVVQEGTEVNIGGVVTDPGNDTVMIEWQWSNSSNSITMVEPDDTGSVFSAELQDHIYDDPCVYTIELSAVDDDGGESTASVDVIVTGDETRYASSSYWEAQYRDIRRTSQSVVPMGWDRLECYLEIVEYVSGVFSEERAAGTIPEAYEVLTARRVDGSRRLAQLDEALLTAWLNFADGVVDFDDLVDTSGDGTGDTPLDVVMDTAEAVRLDSHASSRELKQQIRILERIEHAEQVDVPVDPIPLPAPGGAPGVAPGAVTAP